MQSGPKENATPTIYPVKSSSELLYSQYSDNNDPNISTNPRPYFVGSDDVQRLLSLWGSNHQAPNVDFYPHEYDDSSQLDGNKSYAMGDKSIVIALKHIIEKANNEKVGQEQLGDLRVLKEAQFVSVQKSSCGDGAAHVLGPAFVPCSNGKTRHKKQELVNGMASEMNENSQKRIERDRVTADEIFEIIRSINDPEHPHLTLEQLNVVTCDQIFVNDAHPDVPKASNLAATEGKKVPGFSFLDQGTRSFVDVRFTPTIPHCSMATLIGLCLRVKLLRSLPMRFKVTIRINPGTHASEMAINRQLNDKERVAAALENNHLLTVVNKCVVGS